MNPSHDSRMAVKRHEMLTDLADTARELMTDYGVPAIAAELVADALADHVAKRWGGQQFTIPKDVRFSNFKRDLEIFQRFTGDNYDALASEYHLSERGMRKLISRVRAQIQQAAQPSLFDQS